MPIGPGESKPKERALAPKGIFAPGALKDAKIEPDPFGQNVSDFRRNHPILATMADYISPAWDPNNPVGPTDILNSLPMGEVGKAGLPFAAYLSKLKKGSIFHGTQKVFEHFDPSKNDTSDVLGWMTHFAEDPNYSTGYASGQHKGAINISMDPAMGPVEKQELDPNLKYGTRRSELLRPRMIPAIPEAKNVLDLVDPNPDDLSQAIAALNPTKRADAIFRFKGALRSPDSHVDYLHNPLKASAGALSGKGPGIATRYLAERGLKLTPDEFAKTPFDAIRYNDMTNKSWAIPEGTPIKSKFGAPLTSEIPESQIKMRPMEFGEPKGELPVPVLGSKNKPTSIKDISNDDWNKFFGTDKETTKSEVKFQSTAEKDDWDKFLHLQDQHMNEVINTQEYEKLMKGNSFYKEVFGTDPWWGTIVSDDFKAYHSKMKIPNGSQIKITKSPFANYQGFQPGTVMGVHSKLHKEALDQFVEMGGEYTLLK